MYDMFSPYGPAYGLVAERRGLLHINRTIFKKQLLLAWRGNLCV